MKHRYFCLVLCIIVLAPLTFAQVAPHSALATEKAVKDTWTPPRTSDGHPDLQGFWANNIATPLERPDGLKGRAMLTDDELAKMQNKAHELFGGKGDAAFGDQVYNTVLENVLGVKSGFKSTDGETGDYSSVWTIERVWEKRTSLITDPPDGKMPALTPEGKKRQEAIFAGMTHPASGPEDRLLSERCLTYGSPQLMSGYQSYYQIVQTPQSVMFMTEMIHDVRSIPINGGPHVPAEIQQWMGDSRAHWDGDTLVIDTTNYKPRAFMMFSSDKLHIIERFSRSGPETLNYEVTVDDPGTWTKPWTLMLPFQLSHDPVFEYACHEGNEGMVGILAGARADEAAAAKK